MHWNDFSSKLDGGGVGPGQAAAAADRRRENAVAASVQVLSAQWEVSVSLLREEGEIW